MRRGVVAVLLMMVGAGPSFGGVGQDGTLSEGRVLEVLGDIFGDWAGDSTERLVLFGADGQTFIFRSNSPSFFSFPLADIIRTISRKGVSLGMVRNIVHNHRKGIGFSRADMALEKTLRKYGFTGAFGIYYPETHRIKISKGE